jgi:hypothetical protein
VTGPRDRHGDRHRDRDGGLRVRVRVAFKSSFESRSRSLLFCRATAVGLGCCTTRRPGPGPASESDRTSTVATGRPRAGGPYGRTLAARGLPPLALRHFGLGPDRATARRAAVLRVPPGLSPTVTVPPGHGATATSLHTGKLELEHQAACEPSDRRRRLGVARDSDRVSGTSGSES